MSRPKVAGLEAELGAGCSYSPVRRSLRRAPGLSGSQNLGRRQCSPMVLIHVGTKQNPTVFKPQNPAGRKLQND